MSSTDVRVSMPALLTMTSSRSNFLDRAVDQAFEVGDLADVNLDADGRVTKRYDLSFEGLRRLRMHDVIDDEIRALLGQLQDDGPADAAITAGDDCDLPSEAHVQTRLVHALGAANSVVNAFRSTTSFSISNLASASSMLRFPVSVV